MAMSRLRLRRSVSKQHTIQVTAHDTELTVKDQRAVSAVHIGKVTMAEKRVRERVLHYLVSLNSHREHPRCAGVHSVVRQPSGS